MKTFAIAVLLVLSAIASILYVGSTPERRYVDSACQYRMIYGQERGQQAGLLALGGSRMRVAASGRQFADILASRKPNALPIYNMAHSIFAFEKEYFLLRDFLERHSLKSALIMIEPRQKDFGSLHPDSITIARLNDIPTVVSNLWSEDKAQSLLAARDIFVEHLRFTKRAGKPHKETSLHDCDRLDYRISIEALNAADAIYEQMAGRWLDWDLSHEREDGFLKWMAAFRALEEKHDFELFFLLMTGTSEPLPVPGFDETFKGVTGHELITLDENIHATLSKMGKRDSSHINETGREVFIPWLIERIDERCERPDGCL